jgi:hypothetical protein
MMRCDNKVLGLTDDVGFGSWSYKSNHKGESRGDGDLHAEDETYDLVLQLGYMRLKISLNLG